MHELEKRAILARAARGLGRAYWRAGQNAPGTVLLGTAGTLALGPMMLAKDPAAKQEAQLQKMRKRSLAAQAGGLGMKTASVHFDRDEVLEGVAIRRQLEKLAAKGLPVNKLLDLSKAQDFFAAGAGLAAAGGLMSGVGAGTAFGAGKLMEAAHGAGREKRYGAMLKADPTLKSAPQARVFFNVLDKASPYISGEPQVAAATVRTMLESPEGYALHPKMMKDILGVEESRQKTRFPALRAPTFKTELPEMD